MSQRQQSSVRNRLLLAMSPDDFSLLEPHLEQASFELRAILNEAGDTLTHVSLIEEGTTSLLTESEEGRFEIGMAGPEGLNGVSMMLGVEKSPFTSLVQAPLACLRIPVERLKAAMAESPTLKALLLRYVHAHLVQVAQTAYANAGYSLEARLARWILMTHDRAEGDEIPLTHEFLSMMLGTRRPGMTLAVQVLEGNGMIRAKRGRVTVLSREKLEELAGDAYGLAESEYASAIQSPLRKSAA